MMKMWAFPFYREVDWDSDRLHNLSKITHLAKAGMESTSRTSGSRHNYSTCLVTLWGKHDSLGQNRAAHGHLSTWCAGEESWRRGVTFSLESGATQGSSPREQTLDSWKTLIGCKPCIETLVGRETPETLSDSQGFWGFLHSNTTSPTPKLPHTAHTLAPTLLTLSCSPVCVLFHHWDRELYNLSLYLPAHLKKLLVQEQWSFYSGTRNPKFWTCCGDTVLGRSPS